MNMANVSRIESLSKNNYDTWKIQMEALLIRNDLWGFVNGSIPVINEEDQNSKIALDRWTKDDGKAKSEIILCISPSELKQVKSCISSLDVWKRLEGIYQSQGPARKATLLKKLILQRMEDGVEVRDHMNNFFDAVDKLNEMSVTINSDLLAIMLLYSLPSSFENFRCAIESRDELPTPEALRVKIIEESDARKNESRNDYQNAMFVNKKTNQWRRQNMKLADTKASEVHDLNRRKTSDTFKFRCHRCRKIGHKSSDCKSKIENKPSSANFAENISLLTSETCHASFPNRKLN